jgi:hypothetical protein
MQQAEETSGATRQAAVTSSNPILNDFEKECYLKVPGNDTIL